MEWLLLILLIPLIVVPVVLLCGFAGCGTVLEISPDDPKGVTDLTAKAIGVDKIILAWLNDLEDVAKYEILRAEKNPPLGTVPLPSDVTFPSFLDSPGTGLLKEGTTFIYQVRAVDFAGAPLASGLSNEARATTLPEAPTLEAIPLHVDQILLNWTTHSSEATKFNLQHRLPGGSFTDLPIAGSALSYTHAVPPGSQHEYQVFAIVVNGFDESIQKDVRSAPSNLVSKKPLAFEIVVTDDQSGLEGFCLVQKIASAQLKNSGPKVNITLRGSTVGSLTIDKVYISQVALSGDPWDSAADLKEVASGVVLPANTPRTLGPIDYTIPNPPKDLLIAFDISAAAGQGNVRSILLPGAVFYYRGTTSQASVFNRYPDLANPLLTFSALPGRHYLVEKIEVL